MKVLHLTTHLNIGGITTHLLQLCRGLKKSGIEPQIASSGGEMTDAFQEYQIKTHLIPLKTKHELSFKIVRSYFSLKNLYAEERWDFIHAHTRVSQWLAHLLSTSLNIPYFTTFHGFYHHHHGRKLFPCLGSHALAISNAVEQDLKNRYPAASNRISTVHFGLDLARFQPNAISENEKRSFKQKIGLKEIPTLGIIARLSPEKGHLELLDIVSLLHQKRAIQLLIVGDGQLKKEIIQKIEALKLGNIIFMLPPQKDPRLALSVIDIYVSFLVGREGFGISLIEAMAMEKPVVTSDKGGGIIDFIENGRNGFILTEPSKKQMAEKIEELIEHPELRSQIAETALQTVKERFSYEKMGERVFSIYKQKRGDSPVLRHAWLRTPE